MSGQRPITDSGYDAHHSHAPLKDFRRIATRYGELAANFLSAVAFATIIAFWV